MTNDVRSFEDLGVDDAIVKALADAGITSPFPIQELSLPMALAGADLIGQARTGTGKTLAFGIPLVQRVDPAAGYTQALVIVPTRELCLQVHDDLTIAGAKRDVQVVAAYGGRSIDPQSEAIAAGASIVVGTPGRLLDLCRRRLLDLSRASALVLDEADEMLDMGFLPDVEQLIERCPEQRQTLLFSATMPSEVIKLARRYMDKPTFMRTDVEQQQHVAPKTRQHFFACHRLDKPAVVGRILAAPGRGRTLIFTRTKRMADVLAGELRDRNIDAGVIHSDLRQDARERSLAKFRNGSVDVLCATEVAARGLDIDDVTHVINYDCPDDERMYLHRIGRTGRAGAAGVAVTLAVWNELARLDMIKRTLDIDQPTQEVLSTSPILDDLFGEALPPARVRRADRPASDGQNGQGKRSRRSSGRGERRAKAHVATPVVDDDDSTSEAADEGPKPDVAAGPADPPQRRGTRQRRRRRTVTRVGGAAASAATRSDSTSVTAASAGAADATDDTTDDTEDTGATDTTDRRGDTDSDAHDGSGNADASSGRRRSTRRRRTTRTTRGARRAAQAGANGSTPSSATARSNAPARADATAVAEVVADSAPQHANGTADHSGNSNTALDGGGEIHAGSSEGSSRTRGSRRRRAGRGRRGGRGDARRPSADRQVDRRQDDRRHDDRRQAVASTGELRGGGQPARNRPMRITHLP